MRASRLGTSSGQRCAAIAFGIAIALGASDVRANGGGGYSDCFARLPLFLPDPLLDAQTDGVETSFNRCLYPAPTPTGVFPTGTPGPYGAYIDARSSYSSVVQGAPYDEPLLTPAPVHRSGLTFTLGNYALQPTINPFNQPAAAAGSNLQQLATGSHTLGSTTAMAHVEYDVDMLITLTPSGDSGDRALFVGEAGITFVPPSGPPDFASIEVDSSGDTLVPPGITIVETPPGSGIYLVSGTFVTDSFAAPTNGTSFSFSSTFFVQGYLEQTANFGDPVGGTVEIDAGETVVLRLVSDDPNATFSLPIPSPEPATTLLFAVAVAALATQVRRKR